MGAIFAPPMFVSFSGAPPASCVFVNCCFRVFCGILQMQQTTVLVKNRSCKLIDIKLVSCYCLSTTGFIDDYTIRAKTKNVDRF